MRVITSPQSAAFAADLNDYVIDSDASITFDVKKGNRLILQEEYSPDGNWMIRTHKLGKFCAAGLWGRWPAGSTTVQDKLVDSFSFLIDGVVNSTCRIFGSRCKVNRSPVNVQALSLASHRVTHMGSPEYVTTIIAASQSVTVYATDVNGGSHSSVLYSHTGSESVVTVDVSPATIASRFAGTQIYSYQVCGQTFVIDQTQYLHTHSFRFMNSFECPEAVTASGSFAVKAAQKSETAFMNGVERKFRVTQRDEYTVNSGVIFSQADYKIWHELISARQVQALIDDDWVDIIITKYKFERSYQKNILKSVEFSFVLADPDENPQL